LIALELTFVFEEVIEGVGGKGIFWVFYVVGFLKLVEVSGLIIELTIGTFYGN
jgi:hypothetical protein